jgi:hypothetical protein
MTVIAKSIDILEDGKLIVILSNNDKVYLQPTIKVNTKTGGELLTLHGEDGNDCRVTKEIEAVNSVPFSGDFLALESTIRELAYQSNSINNSVKHGDKFSLSTKFTSITLTAAKTEYLVYLFRVKGGGIKASIQQVVASVLSDTNDDFEIITGLRKEFDHAFVDGDFKDVHPDSKIQVATPGINGVPVPVIALGFFTATPQFPQGRDLTGKMGSKQTEIQLIDNVPMELFEGLTYAVCLRAKTANAKLDLVVNWEEK